MLRAATEDLVRIFQLQARVSSYNNYGSRCVRAIDVSVAHWHPSQVIIMCLVVHMYFPLILHMIGSKF